MSSATTRIAVLIDSDNVSPTHASPVLEELASYGTPTIKRAYGDWTTPYLSGWKKELNNLAIQPIQQFAYTTGKNSTDSAMIIDAMDLLWTGNVEAFAIVSSDSDFTRLATRLRESGKKVIGMGQRKTPASLRNAVDQFIYLELLGASDDEADESAETTPTDAAASSSSSASPRSGSQMKSSGDEPASRINLQSALTKAINATSGDDGWTTLSLLGQYLSRSHADFDPRDFGHRKLSDLVAEQPYLEHRTEDNRMQAKLKARRRP